MTEGLSYIAGTEVPCVLIDVVRGGPGLGNIAPSQGDYNQLVHGGGHGDYHNIVLAPASVQEAIDLTVLAFDLAEKYRTIAMVMADGCVGQMMEPAEMPEMRPIRRFGQEWATTGALNREAHKLSSIFIDPTYEELYNIRILHKWMEITQKEVRYKEYYLDDAEFAVIGFGTAGRIALTAVRAARAKGIKVGLFRPISVSPYPYDVVDELAKRVKGILVVEMNTGQMLDDVRLAAKGRVPIEFYGRPGGMLPNPDDLLGEIQHLVKNGNTLDGDPRLRWLQRINDGSIILS